MNLIKLTRPLRKCYELQKINQEQIILTDKTKQEFKVKQKLPKQLSEKEWKEFFTIKNQVHRETYPSDDPLPDHEQIRVGLLKQLKHWDRFFWFVYSPENELVAYSSLIYTNPNNPDYYRSKHKCQTHIFVNEQYRRIGLATNLLKIILAKTKEEGKTILQTDVYLDSAVKFIEQVLNAKPAKVGYENRLYFNKVDWNMMEEWVEEGKQRAKGVVCKFYTEIPENILQDYCDISNATLEDEPSGDLEETFTLTPELYRKYLTDCNENGITWISALTFEEDGRISAVSDVTYNTKRPREGSQGFTGVKKDCRGRGLGKWVKAAMLLYLRENYPTIKFVRAGNASANAAILSINRRMGFQTIFHRYDFNIKIDDIGNKLN